MASMVDPPASDFSTFEPSGAAPTGQPVMPWELEAAPRAVPGSSPPGNLPRRRRFVGRAEALRQIDDALSDPRPAAGVVSLTGLAGTGKTALALEHAHRAALARTYPGGVW